MFCCCHPDKLLHHRQMDAAVRLSHRNVRLGLCRSSPDDNDNNHRDSHAPLMESCKRKPSGGDLIRRWKILS